MYANATLIGHAGKDPETKTTSGGVAVTQFSIATSEKRKNKDGEREEITTWWKVVTFGKLGEIVQQYVKKGSRVFVDGSVSLEQWEGKDGSPHAQMKVVANTVKFLDRKADAPAQASAAPSGEVSDEDIDF